MRDCLDVLVVSLLVTEGIDTGGGGLDLRKWLWAVGFRKIIYTRIDYKYYY